MHKMLSDRGFPVVLRSVDGSTVRGKDRDALKHTADGHPPSPEKGVQAGPAQCALVLCYEQACGVVQPLDAEAPALRQAHLQHGPEAIPAQRITSEKGSQSC